MELNLIGTYFLCLLSRGSGLPDPLPGYFDSTEPVEKFVQHVDFDTIKPLLSKYIKVCYKGALSVRRLNKGMISLCILLDVLLSSVELFEGYCNTNSCPCGEGDSCG